MLYLDQLRALQARALALGARHRVWRDGRTSLNSLEWDASGSCQKPVTLELYSRPSPVNGRNITVQPGSEVPARVIMQVRCRVCPACLRARAATWRMRAQAEFRASGEGRTWFGTLTLNPEAQYRALCVARERLYKQGIDLEALGAQEQFIERHRVISRDLTLFLKRLRANTGERFRYLLVAEAHKSGLPHYHLLLHETTGPIRKAILHETWKLGFSSWKLARDAASASYLCKYLSKSALARVRASGRYGKTTSVIASGSEGVTTTTPDDDTILSVLKEGLLNGRPISYTVKAGRLSGPCE